jgi:hypothetical protein
VGVIHLDDGVHLIRRAVEGEPDAAYLVRKTAAAWGVAFEVAKLFRSKDDDGPPSYHVNLDCHKPERSTCECRGFLRWGHRKACRHVSSLLALIRDGKLDGNPVRPTCACGAPAVTGPVGGECQRCADAAADRSARLADLEEAEWEALEAYRDMRDEHRGGGAWE